MFKSATSAMSDVARPFRGATNSGATAIEYALDRLWHLHRHRRNGRDPGYHRQGLLLQRRRPR